MKSLRCSGQRDHKKIKWSSLEIVHFLTGVSHSIQSTLNILWVSIQFFLLFWRFNLLIKHFLGASSGLKFAACGAVCLKLLQKLPDGAIEIVTTATWWFYRNCYYSDPMVLEGLLLQLPDGATEIVTTATRYITTSIDSYNKYPMVKQWCILFLSKDIMYFVHYSWIYKVYNRI